MFSLLLLLCGTQFPSLTLGAGASFFKTFQYNVCWECRGSAGPKQTAKDCVRAHRTRPDFCRDNIWSTLQRALDDGVDFGTFQEGNGSISRGLQNWRPSNATKYDFSFRNKDCGEFWRKDRYDRIEESGDLEFAQGRPYSISLFQSKGAGAAIPAGKYVLLVNAHFEHVKAKSVAWPTSKFNTFFTEPKMKAALPKTYPTLKAGDLALILFQGDLNRAVNSNELQVWTPTDTKGNNLQNLEHTSPDGPKTTYIDFDHPGWNVWSDKYSLAKVTNHWKPDNILYWQAPNSLKLSKRSFDVWETTGAASDHLPVLATLEFGGPDDAASLVGTNARTGAGHQIHDGVHDGDDEAPVGDDGAPVGDDEAPVGDDEARDDRSAPVDGVKGGDDEAPERDDSAVNRDDHTPATRIVLIVLIAAPLLIVLIAGVVILVLCLLPPRAGEDQEDVTTTDEG